MVRKVSDKRLLNRFGADVIDAPVLLLGLLCVRWDFEYARTGHVAENVIERKKNETWIFSERSGLNLLGEDKHVNRDS